MNLLRLLTSFISILLAQGAWAANDMPVGLLKQEARSPASVTSEIKIQGSLAGSTGCNVAPLSDMNQATQACELRVSDSKTGLSYLIESGTWVADDARTLYQSGVRNVAVQGHLTAANLIQAQGIQKTN